MKKIESKLSKRLHDIVLALPLFDGILVLEIGCGPGAMAREIAIRVGAFDGRHPEMEKQSLKNIAKNLKNGGRFFIDGGNLIKEINLDNYK